MNETTTKDLAAGENLQDYQRTLDGPGWLADLRAAALERFVSLEWPTTREEEWRRSNLSAFEFDTYTVTGDAAARPSCDTRTGSRYQSVSKQLTTSNGHGIRLHVDIRLV